jgi:hypothetical protein
MSNSKKAGTALQELKTVEPVDAGLDTYLRAQAIVEAINANMPKGSTLPAIPKNYVFKKQDRETVSVALHSAFELIGGVPSLVYWAAGNPKEFYGLWSKLLPSQTETPMGGVNISFVSPIVESPLDRVTVDGTGRVYTLDAFGSEELPE